MVIDYLLRATHGVQGLQPYIPGKPVEELQRELGLEHIVKLASNENPLGPSPLGKAAASGELEGLNWYPDDVGFRLKQKLAAHHGVTAEQITLGAGSSDVIDMVARSFLGPGRNAVYSEHSFAMYAIYTQAAGAEAKIAEPLPLIDEMPYGHDLDAMAALIDDDTRVVFIANPNNPTGTWLTEAALYAFVESVPSDVVIVLDEAYTEYVTEPGFPDGVKWLGDFPNLIVTRTFSKIYGLAALRVGYGLASPELTAVINRVRHPFNVNAVALAAAEAALDDHDFIARSVANNQAGMQQYLDAFADMGLDSIPSVANFVCVEVARSGTALFQQMLQQGVIVRPVANYNLPEHLRITIGTEAENAACIAALKACLT